MINTLLLLRKCMHEFGVSCTPSCHTKLKNQPGTVGYKLFINNVGVPTEMVRMSDYPATQYIYKSDHCNSPTFKSDPKKKMRTINLEFTAQLPEYLGGITDEPELKALKELSRRVALHHDDKFKSLLGQIAVIIANERIKNKKIGVFYVCMELDDFIDYPNGVQSTATFEAVEKKLCKKDSGIQSNIPHGWNGTLDFFGNPLDGWEKPFDKSANHNLRLYSKNDDTHCYSRYGLNANTSCPMGFVTRKYANDAWQTFTAPEHKERIWYADYCNGNCYIVISNIDHITGTEFECDIDERNKKLKNTISLYEWIEKNKNQLDTMVNHTAIPTDAVGKVFVIFKPSQGAASVLGSMQRNMDELLLAQREWINGLDNLPSNRLPFNRKMKPVTIRNVCNLLSSRFKQSGMDVEFVKSVRRFTIMDAYRLFFSNSRTVHSMLTDFSNLYAPEMVRAGRIDHLNIKSAKMCFSVGHYFPLAGLLLRKSGIAKEQIMNSWAFLFGRTAHEADRLNIAYFKGQGNRKVPSDIIGYRSVQTAYRNPTTALDQIIKQTMPYVRFVDSSSTDKRKWHELKVYCSTYEYKSLLTQLSQLPIPTKLTSADRIMMGVGYNHLNVKRENSGAEKPEQVEVDVIYP